MGSVRDWLRQQHLCELTASGTGAVLARGPRATRFAGGRAAQTRVELKSERLGRGEARGSGACPDPTSSTRRGCPKHPHLPLPDDAELHAP